MPGEYENAENAPCASCNRGSEYAHVVSAARPPADACGHEWLGGKPRSRFNAPGKPIGPKALPSQVSSLFFFVLVVNAVQRHTKFIR